ncbi:hypothetical protein QC999_gp23 [Microbacterium phage Cressida]|uniref:Uncharacterized protein n=1 Tax=Microbacterium phage Cressida TaxID=2591216 RepID=A0A514DIA5_9CAUD|nr:hypothetical protein QC999_gp23 [Microbacterium phage Cressida]QDH93327.1 hypothetical protein PBI_CRESSIDA_85 [Microbacterium phage Cressida]
MDCEHGLPIEPTPHRPEKIEQVVQERLRDRTTAHTEARTVSMDEDDTRG